MHPTDRADTRPEPDGDTRPPQCPPWCAAQRHPYETTSRRHAALIGHVSAGGHRLAVYARRTDEPDPDTGHWTTRGARIDVAYADAAHLDNLDDDLLGLTPAQATATAAIADTLGRPDLAALLRKAAALITESLP